MTHWSHVTPCGRGPDHGNIGFMFYQTGNISADHDDAGTLMLTLVALNMLGVASVGGILLLAGAGPVL